MFCGADDGATDGAGVFCGGRGGGGRSGSSGVVAEGGEPGFRAGAAVCVETVEKGDRVVEKVGAYLVETSVWYWGRGRGKREEGFTYRTRQLLLDDG